MRAPRDPVCSRRVLDVIVTPNALHRLRYGDDGRCTYKGRFHPRLGRDYQFVTGLEFLAMIVPHIALRYEAKIRYFGALSTRKRIQCGWIGRQTETQPPTPTVLDEEESDFVRVRRKSWARLIARTFHDDPDLCPKSRQR